ncbi:MAG: von Willebrand factor type A domain-containing protein [Lewinella sp.]|nr:von Willebrand factor type A domain-containing protein [Lewinella sp.]
MMKKHILLLGISALFLTAFSVFWNTPLSGQRTITGHVYDPAGQPLIGATVLVKSTPIGTVTDFDGKYSIHLPEGSDVLYFSYTGFTSKEVKVVKQSQIDVYLTEEVEMEEVIVTGYSRSNESKKSSKVRSQAARAVAAKPGLSGNSGIVFATAPPPPPLSPPSSLMPAMDNGYDTEDYSAIRENRFLRPLNAPLSTFSIDVDAASYSNMRRFLNEGQLPPPDAVRIEEMVNYFSYDYPEPQGYEPFTVNTELGACPWQPKHRLLHIGLQGKRIPTAQLPKSNLVFLLDVSGSMGDPNKLPLVKESLKLLTESLRPEDKVSIVVYAGAAGVVLPATAGSNKQRIIDALEGLEAGGSTAGGQGIQLAYNIARENLIKGGNNRVILATDGDFNVGVSSDAELVRLIEKERNSGVFLTVLGFGMGNYKDNKMQQLADKGNGNHAYIDNISEARKVLISEFGGTLFTIAKDVKLQIEFNPTKVAGYRLIGYENRLLNDEDFADDTKDAGELGAGHTVTALYEIIPAGVESEFLADVGELKYQQTQVKNDGGDELCTVKLRYKQPDGDTSKLLEQVVNDNTSGGQSLSENFYWSAAVAEFGMLLRDSEFKGTASFESCAGMAEKVKGEDRNGYRKEMIVLIRQAEALRNEATAGK